MEPTEDLQDYEIDDHLEPNEQIECGYCGKPFQSHEVRIEKNLYGREWVFCNEECLEDFRDASNFTDENPDVHHAQDPDEITPNMSVTITGPIIDDE